MENEERSRDFSAAEASLHSIMEAYGIRPRMRRAKPPLRTTRGRTRISWGSPNLLSARLGQVRRPVRLEDVPEPTRLEELKAKLWGFWEILYYSKAERRRAKIERERKLRLMIEDLQVEQGKQDYEEWLRQRRELQAWFRKRVKAYDLTPRDPLSDPFENAQQDWTWSSASDSDSGSDSNSSSGSDSDDDKDKGNDE